jgi:hypothetical protein
MKLVFLHNRKTAGTSFRVLIGDLIGTKHVYWKHSQLLESDRENVESSLVVGGHFDIENVRDYLPTKERALYLTCVREPISRVISLFNHHRTKDNWTGKKEGFDDISLSNTFHNCKYFRELIKNEQCFVISGKRDYKSVTEILLDEEFIIGTSENSDLFMEHVSKMLALGNVKLPNSNRAVGNIESGTEVNEELRIELESFLSEDFKLYEFVSSKKLVSTFKCEYPFLAPYKVQNSVISSTTRSKVEIFTAVLGLEVKLDTDFFVPIKVYNSNDIELPTYEENRIFASYHVFDSSYNLLSWDGVRSDLPSILKSKQHMNINVKIAAFSEPGEYLLKLGLLHETVSWFESDNPKHEIVVKVKVS